MYDSLKMLLVDDDAFARQALKLVIKASFQDALLTEADSVEAALEHLRSEQWDLVILDLALGEKSGLSVIHYVQAESLDIPILVLSSQREQNAAIPAFKAGARGFITKNEAVSVKHLQDAIQKVISGRKYVSESLASQLVEVLDEENQTETTDLSAQESRVLFYIASGKSAKEIAALMNINEKTVRTYRARLSQKLQLKSDAEFVRYALQHGIIS